MTKGHRAYKGIKIGKGQNIEQFFNKRGLSYPKGKGRANIILGRRKVKNNDRGAVQNIVSQTIKFIECSNCGLKKLKIIDFNELKCMHCGYSEIKNDSFPLNRKGEKCD